MKINYNNITYEQISMMKHAIGFSNDKVTGTKHRKYTAWRNFYDSGAFSNIKLDELVELGLMTRHENVFDNYIYHVNAEGRKFLWEVTGVEILKEEDSII